MLTRHTKTYSSSGSVV